MNKFRDGERDKFIKFILESNLVIKELKRNIEKVVFLLDFIKYYVYRKYFYDDKR